MHRHRYLKVNYILRASCYLFVLILKQYSKITESTLHSRFLGNFRLMYRHKIYLQNKFYLLNIITVNLIKFKIITLY